MLQKTIVFISVVALTLPLISCTSVNPNIKTYANTIKSNKVQLGPRPFYLVNDMQPGALKNKLLSCGKRNFKKTDFSIGHRGAPLQFPEHTKESYLAAAHQGAGIIECDVTFTSDAELVCRHSQCDLHTTTNILATPLAEQCAIPPDFNSDKPFEHVKCCTSDITLAEFKSLQGKMDAGNPNTETLEEYFDSTPNFRTDLYTGNGTLLSHKESIELFKSLNRKMTPELKSGDGADIIAIFGSQEAYAQKMIDEYIEAGIPPRKVWPQSFNLDDVLYWINTASTAEYSEQAVFLDGRYDDPAFDHTDPNTWSPTMEELAAKGVQIIAPPMWMLVKAEAGEIKPSIYAMKAKAVGLDIITWTLEHSGLLQNGGGWYYQTISNLVNDDGDTMRMLDVLAKDVGIIGIFSDWPATVTYYANCMNLK
jgi:glycerophosphoryl diester phosphodiesterase